MMDLFVIRNLDFIFQTTLGELPGLPQLLILVGRLHNCPIVCTAISTDPPLLTPSHPKTVSVLHKKGIHDNIFWGDFSLDHQFVWLKKMKIRRVGNTSRHRWAEIRSLPQSLWMGELIRWFLFFCHYFFVSVPFFCVTLSCCCLFCLCIFVVRWWFLCNRLLCRAPFICKWATLFLETQMQFHSQKYAIFLQMGDLIFSYTNILLQNMQILADGRPYF